MNQLDINDDNINIFITCDTLKILKLIVKAQNNIQLILNNLYKFTNLQHLTLSNNQITEIKGLDNLVNLQQLHLDANKIKKIKGLDNLIN